MGESGASNIKIFAVEWRLLGFACCSRFLVAAPGDGEARHGESTDGSQGLE